MGLMKLDTAIGKTFNQEPDLSWRRYSRVEVSPDGAIEMRGYAGVEMRGPAGVVPMGAAPRPIRRAAACGG